MRNDTRNPFHILENGVDMVLNFAAFYLCYYFVVIIKIPGSSKISIEDNTTIVLLFAAVIVCSFIYQFYDVYRPIPYIGSKYSISPVVLSNITFFGVSLILVAIFANPAIKLFVLTWVLSTALVSTIVLVFKKQAMIYIVHLTRKQRDIVKKVIIVGDNRDPARSFVKEVIKDKHNGIMVLGCVGRKMSHDTGCEKLGDFEDLVEIIEKYKPDYAVFSVDSYDKKNLIKLVNICDERCVKVFFLPVIYGFFKSSKQLDRVGTIPLINVHSTPLDNRFNAFVKRTVDVIGALFLIIITSPIMLMAAIGVRLSSPGPIFFKQVRVGSMGKKFMMLKFRSMRVNNESNTAWSTGNDPRKTRFGTFIRKTAIDELPQFFNVLKGDMSLVGPRPEIPFYVDYFKERVPLYMVKHYVKPGITGLAQINGFRGDTSIEDRIHADISYLENWSLALDLYILLKTPFKALNKSEKFNDGSKNTKEEEEKAKDILVVENPDGSFTVDEQKLRQKEAEQEEYDSRDF